jgi:pimeloyl-ACP methyl ester carboxylesterase
VDEDEAEDEGIGQPEGGRLDEGPRHLWRVLRAAVDYLALNTETGREMMVKAKPYPDPFVFSHLEGYAGAELGCWTGFRDGQAPLVLFVPGTFATKDAGNTRTKVVGVFEESDVHACAMDLRGFGHSSELHSTAGYLEAMDVANIAESFQANPRVTDVVLIGESLGASTVLGASRHSPDAIDGVIALNPFADLGWMIRRLSNRSPGWDAARLVNQAFEVFLRHVTGDEATTFEEYMLASAANIGTSWIELVHETSPRNHVVDTSVPTLVLHAVDDPVIPAFHAHVLERAARGNPNVEVHMTELGGHASFDIVDSDWYWETVISFIREVRA